MKKNPGSHTPGTDKKTIDDIEKLTDEQLVNKIQKNSDGTDRKASAGWRYQKGTEKTVHLGFPQSWTGWCNSAYYRY